MFIQKWDIKPLHYYCHYPKVTRKYIIDVKLLCIMSVFCTLVFNIFGMQIF